MNHIISNSRYNEGDAMPEKQTDINKDRKQKLEKFMKAMPDMAKRIGAHMMEAYKDGAIDSKTKRLMAMAIALGAGCENCIMAQTELALELGATREEILETIGVVTSMRGTTGVAESLRVIQLLDEMGKL